MFLILQEILRTVLLGNQIQLMYPTDFLTADLKTLKETIKDEWKIDNKISESGYLWAQIKTFNALNKDSGKL